MQLLTDEFIDTFPNEPEHMNDLGKFVFYRTYSRWLEGKGRRETFKEAIRRAVEYNVSLSIKQTEKNGFDVQFEDIQNEAQMLFRNIFNLQQFLSGRTHWVGGADTKVAEKYPLSNFNCFSEETEFLTDIGIKSFKDFDHNDTINVLNGNGSWSEAIVKNFGKQKLVKLTIRRKGTRYTEDIYTTKEHLWFVDKYDDGHYIKLKTEELKKGDILRSKRRYEHTNLNMCNIGIQHGIVFGDGTYDKRKNHCRISLIGDKQELLKYFTTGTTCTEGDRDSTLVYGLPHYFKKLPPIDSNVEYIKGFIYGLLLADGKIDSSVRISQANFANVVRIQDMCEIIGLTTSKLKEVIRVNNNLGDYGSMYQFTIHKENIIKHGLFTDVYGEEPNVLQWVVEDIEETDRYEDVWCVIEPITNSFTLRGGVHTHNCAFTEVNVWEDLVEMFYLLLIGTGVGVSCSREMAKKLPPVRRNYELVHSEYKPVIKSERLEDTKLTIMDNGYAKIYVGDSKEGK